MDRLFCHSCGFSQTGAYSDTVRMLCPKCGLPLKHEKNISTLPPPPASGPMAVTKPEYKTIRFEFKGDATTFFRIWVVNLFFTIITVGIYAAWAKVRNRRYLYAHTHMGGYGFDYTAEPVALLKGHALIGLGLLAYFLTRSYQPAFTLGIIIFFYLAVPFLLYKSLRFFARNAAYRNIHFRFNGTARKSYQTYLLLPALIPVTLGLIYPYWGFARKRYFMGNMSLGTTPLHFRGKSRKFYQYYLWAVVFTVFLLVSVAILLAFLFMGLRQLYADPGVNATVPPIHIYYYTMGGYVLFFLIVAMIQQFVYARVSNYCWCSSTLGPIRFNSELKASRLIWIRVTNIIAILLSCGLLIPWTRIRRVRYILSCLTILMYGNLDDFVADDEQPVGALGETAREFFDFEIGL